MRELLRPLVILSVDQAGNADVDNQQARWHFERWCENRGLPYRRVTGWYNGQSETSYVVDAVALDSVMQFAQWYNQESVLLLDSERSGTLHMIATGERIAVGQWTEVREPSGDCYTFCPDEQRYWECI